MAPVLLFGKTPDDPTLIALARAIRGRGGEPNVVVTRGPLPLTLAAHAPGSSTVAGLRADQIAGAYVGAIPPRFGLDPARPGAPLEPGDFLARQARADGQRDALCALLGWLHGSGRAVLNPPAGGTYVQNKLEHLYLAASAGLQVPDSAWGGIPAGEALVRKPVRAGAVLAASSGEGVAADPAFLLQKRIHGRPVRALVLDGQVLSAAALEGLTALDSRQDPVFQRGEARYLPVALDAGVIAALERLLRTLGLRFAGVDFLEDEDGLWFLEANAAPIFVEHEEKTGHPIAGPLADCLLGRPRG